VLLGWVRSGPHGALTSCSIGAVSLLRPADLPPVIHASAGLQAGRLTDPAARFAAMLIATLPIPVARGCDQRLCRATKPLPCARITSIAMFHVMPCCCPAANMGPASGPAPGEPIDGALGACPGSGP